MSRGAPTQGARGAITRRAASTAAVGVLLAAPISWFMVRVPRGGFAVDPEAVHIG
ncbi:hypothetical protein [Subtercola boreus]|uniref:hypothetical protein n=1 Tax=Subtercola boreus TaxID=120213 RepID=UPI001559DF1F|nr:hypothetical protein [Subtercola boreus]